MAKKKIKASLPPKDRQLKAKPSKKLSATGGICLHVHKNTVPSAKRGRDFAESKICGMPDEKLEFDQNTESGSDEDIFDENNVSASAYQVLLGSLQANGGPFARAYAQRQKEEQGVSSSEEGDDDANEVQGNNANGGALIAMDSHERESILGIDKKEGPSDDEEERRDFRVAESDEESEDDEASTSLKSFSNAFKKHLEHTLTEREAAVLSEGKLKFKCETNAAGFKQAKWMTSAPDFPKEERKLSNYGVKLRLRKNWTSLQEDLFWGDFQTHRQCQFFSFCNSYRDILHSRRPSLYSDSDKEDLEILDAYLLHVLNHVFKTRDLVTKNNEKVVSGTSSMSRDPEALRDQGFTRPKVLMILPLRSSALRVVKRLLELLPSSQKVSVEHQERFFEEFGVEDDSEVENETLKGRKTSKPADFHALFGGNNDDHFRIGIKFTRKSVKLYSDFYSSDMIIASPLGLITRIGEAESEKDKDVDFLSSIEIMVIDYADVILMQNWSHVMEISNQLNVIPAQQHGTDFMRIREWYLNGHGRYFRQTIVLSTFVDAGINSFFNRSCSNFAGKLKLRSEYSGVLSKVLLQVRQVYERVECSTLTGVDDSRFELFTKQVFGPLKESLQDGVMIFVSSYFDFVRLRNFLKSQSMSFCLLGEYTKQSDISRARAWFFHGKRQILLYTERAHFYHRYKIRGIKDLIFYSLPEHAEFYAEITNMMEGLENPSSSVIFSSFDNLKLERVVGTSRANKMLNSENSTFMFC